MSTLAKLLVTLGLDSSDFSSGIAQVENRTSAFGNVVKSATGLAVIGFAAVAGGAAAAGLSGLNFNNSMEIVTAQLNAFTKDGAKSAEILAMIKDRASKTPFAFEEMAKATASLLPAAKASGKGLEELISVAEVLAASNPAEGLEGAAFSLKEALSGDFVSIIERFNLPRQRLKELKEEGVPALEAVQIAMKELGLDTDLVTNLSNTASGRWSTLKDTMVGVAAVATKPMFDLLSSSLGRVNDYLAANQPLVDAFATTLAGYVQSAIDGVSYGIGLIVQGFQLASTILPIVTQGFNAFATAINPLIQYFTAVISGGDTLNDWLTHLPTILQPIIGVMGNYVAVWVNLGNTITTVVSLLMGGNVQGAWNALISGLGLVVTSYQTYVSSLYTLLSGVGTWLATNLPIWGAAFVTWIQPYIPVALAMLNTLINSVLMWIGTQVGPIATQVMTWGNSLVAWITPYIPIAIGYLIGFGQSILDWISTTASTLLAGFTAWANALWVWVPPAIVDFLQRWPTMLDGFLDWIGSAVGPILKKLGDWALAFIQWVVPMIPDLLIALGGLVIALGIFILQTGAVIANKIGNDWGPAFVTWVVTTAIPGLLAALQGLKNSIDGWITATGLALRAQVVKIGTAIIEGIKAGISAAWDGLKSWFVDRVKGLVPAAMSGIDARSPSRMFADQVGNTAIMGGILMGMQAGLPRLLAFIGNAGRRILSETLGVMASFTRSGGIDVFKSLLDLEKVDPFQPLVDATDALKTAQDQALGVSGKLLDLNAEIATLTSTPLDQISDHLKYNQELAALYGEQAVLLNEQANAQANLVNLGQTQAQAQAQSVQQQAMINQIAERARQAYDIAQQQALGMMQTNAKGALDFFNKRKAQIEELAQLEKQRALATTDQQRADLDTQIALTKAAQDAEQTQQAVDIYINSQDQRAMGNEDIIKIIEDALRRAGITVDIRTRTA